MHGLQYCFDTFNKFIPVEYFIALNFIIKLTNYIYEWNAYTMFQCSVTQSALTTVILSAYSQAPINNEHTPWYTVS